MLILAAHTAARGFHLTNTEVAFAVPAGVVLAAIVSLLALRWSTNKSIAAQQLSLDKTLSHQTDTTRATLDAQLATTQLTLDRDRDIRLWDKRAELYSVAGTIINEPIDAMVASGGADYNADLEKFSNYAKHAHRVNSMDGQFRAFADQDTRDAWIEFELVWRSLGYLANQVVRAHRESLDSANDFEDRKSFRSRRDTFHTQFVEAFSSVLEKHQRLSAAMRQALVGDGD